MNKLLIKIAHVFPDFTLYLSKFMPKDLFDMNIVYIEYISKTKYNKFQIKEVPQKYRTFINCKKIIDINPYNIEHIIPPQNSLITNKKYQTLCEYAVQIIPFIIDVIPTKYINQNLFNLAASKYYDLDQIKNHTYAFDKIIKNKIIDDSIVPYDWKNRKIIWFHEISHWDRVPSFIKKLIINNATISQTKKFIKSGFCGCSTTLEFGDSSELTEDDKDFIYMIKNHFNDYNYMDGIDLKHGPEYNLFHTLDLLKQFKYPNEICSLFKDIRKYVRNYTRDNGKDDSVVKNIFNKKFFSQKNVLIVYLLFYYLNIYTKIVKNFVNVAYFHDILLDNYDVIISFM